MQIPGHSNDGVRIQPLEIDELTDEQHAALGTLLDRLPLDHVWGTLARHPELFKKFSVWGNYVLRKSSLDPRYRELAILRIGVLNRCEYEFAQHVQAAMRAGLSEKDIERVSRNDLSDDWSTMDRLILEAVNQLAINNRITDEAWDCLGQVLTEAQMMDLVFTIGTYNMIAWALNSFGVELDPRLNDYRWNII